MVLAIWSYLPTLKFEFTFFDDNRILLQQPKLFAHGSVIHRVENIVFTYPRDEPMIVRDLSWLFDSIVFGFKNPFGYHFMNVLYHGFVLFLLFWLLIQLTDFRVAIISLGIISVLAVHVEPVAWIMGRKDILCALFCLLSMHFYLRFRRQKQHKTRILLYSATVICSIAAYLSKISAVILPMLLALIAVFESIDTNGYARVQCGRKNLTRIALEIAPILLLALIVYGGYQSVLEHFGVLARAHPYSVSDHLIVAFVVNPLVLVEYLKIVIAPDNLSVFYTEPSIDTVFTWRHYVQAISVFALVGLIAWHMWRTNRKALLLLTCFFVILLPYGNWKYFGFSHANRYIYFAVLFLVPAVVAYLLPYFRQTKSWVVKISLVTVFLVVMFNNFAYRQQNLYVWQNGETLWLNEVSRPNAPLRVYNGLTSYYISRAADAKKTERIGWLKKAKASNQMIFNMPIKQHDQGSLAVTYYNEGFVTDDLFEQLQAFEHALDITPTYPAALQAAALCYFNLAQGEQTANKRTLYAQQSLQYYRRLFENPGTLSDSRDQHLMMLYQLKTKFPELEIPELNSTMP